MYLERVGAGARQPPLNARELRRVAVVQYAERRATMYIGISLGGILLLLLVLWAIGVIR
jgi:hypothetical protein